MEKAYRDHGKVLPHVIGKKMGHKYSKEALSEIMNTLKKAVQQSRVPQKVYLQTRTLRYPQSNWVKAIGLKEHWQDSRIDAEFITDASLVINTQNVTHFEVQDSWLRQRGYQQFNKGLVVHIDGQMITLNQSKSKLQFKRNGSQWQLSDGTPDNTKPRKRPGLQGPMDDVLMDRFLVVLPTGKYAKDEMEIKRWVDFELKHFASRWKTLYRGEIQTIKDIEVTEEHLEKYHLIAWGTPSSNQLLGRLFESGQDHFGGIKWHKRQLSVKDNTYACNSHVLMGIMHNGGLSPEGNRYIAVNTGPTFREYHDRTNSLQNPKLPDYAVIDIRHKPDAALPGKVVEAGFFGEDWRLK